MSQKIMVSGSMKILARSLLFLVTGHRIEFLGKICKGVLLPSSQSPLCQILSVTWWERTSKHQTQTFLLQVHSLINSPRKEHEIL